MLIDEAALNGASPRALLQAYEAILGELRRQGVSRTSDAPVGQYAEWLDARVLGATLAANATKSYDLELARRLIPRANWPATPVAEPDR